MPEPQLAAPVPKPAAKRWPREATIFACLLIAAGAIFRIRAFFHWRSLWLDEIYLAHSIVSRGFSRLLFEPLDFWQAAPVGFLAVERLFVDLFGTGERVLRLPSLLAGLGSLPLFFFLIRRMLTLRGTLLALTLFCGLSSFIHYSAELKQYSFDVTVTLAILLSAVRVWEKPESGRDLLVLFVVGAVGMFFSYPAVFVLAGSGAVVLVSRTISHIRAGGGVPLSIAAPLGCIAAWSGLVYCNVHFFMKPLMFGPVHIGLVKFWVDHSGFPPWQPNRAAHWIWAAFDGVMQNWETMHLDAPELGMFAAILGLGSLLMGKRRALGALIALPLVVALVVAFRRQYPFAERLALYMVPILIILIARGIDAIWGAGDLARSAAGGLAAIMIISGPVAQSAFEFRWPTGREETKQMYQWIERNWRPGDLLVISHMGQRSYDYYAPGSGLDGLTQLFLAPQDAKPQDGTLLEASQQGLLAEPWFNNAFSPPGRPQTPLRGYVVLQPDRSDNPARYLDDVDHILHPDPSWNWPQAKRIWFLFVHVNDENPRVDQLCIPEMDRLAQQGVRHEEDGATVYFYDLTGQPSAFAKP